MSKQLPYLSGETYEAMVPDTLDLAEHAKLAFDAVVSAPDPNFEYAPWWSAVYSMKPPRRNHADFVISTPPLLARALPMLRIMTGISVSPEIDANVMDGILSHIGEDGLWYSHFFHTKCPKTKRYGTHYYPLTDEDFAPMQGNFHLIWAMLLWHQLDSDPAWESRIVKLIEGWKKVLFHGDDYVYIPDNMIGEAFSYPRSGWRPGMTREPPREIYGEEGSVFDTFRTPIRGLSLWSEFSGDKEALNLARKFVNFVLKDKFWIDAKHGKFAPESHLHAHLSTLWALLEYARVAQDDRLMNFVREGYEYARTQGIPKLGCLHHITEVCASHDMIALAIRLCEVGVADYWEDVDQYLRNQFIEHQYARPDLLQQMGNHAVESPVNVPYEISDQPIEKYVGYFASTVSPTLVDNWTALCCMLNGSMALYFVWKSMLQCEDDIAQVNLLLNRASPMLDIDSYLPHQGKVVLKNKKAKRILVRIPRWVRRQAIKSTRNGSTIDGFWLNNYLVFDRVTDNDIITIEFPMVETEEKYQSSDVEYTCRFKGNTLVDISPRDERPGFYPMYNRDEYQNNDAIMKTVARYVSPILIDWR
jgi:hypothetical protein